MKKIVAVALSISIFFFSCSDNKNSPNVSAVKVDLQLNRFEQDFFNIDTLAPHNSLPALQQKYPILLPIFLQEILGVDSNSLRPVAANFIRLSKSIYDTVNIVFKNTDWLKKDFESAFKHVKYYFPQYSVPSINTLIGPIDLLAKTTDSYSPNFSRPNMLGISLQFYLGKNFSLYSDEFFITNVAPQYRSRRFEKEYIVSDAMILIVEDLFPDRSSGKPLIEQIISKGKQWWLLDKILPTTADSLKTGYTQDQLDWCKSNEGLIWNYIVSGENLYSVDPAVNQLYIGESPSTQGMPTESPGNIGAWIGWQIVEKFAEKNGNMKPADVMAADTKRILEEAKYKPK